MSTFIRPRTYMAKHNEVSRNWHLIDAQGKPLGRMAVQIADLLRGKGKPIYTPHVDCGDGVVVINAEKIKVSGNKLAAKIYARHSGYPGGYKTETLENLLNRRPTEAVRRAVVGMLPKGPLGDQVAKHLHVYQGPSHPHQAQLKSSSTEKK